LEDKDLQTLTSKNVQSKDVLSISEQIQKKILSSKIPTDIKREVNSAYEILQRNSKHSHRFAVRSSATIEDSKSTSFAGQAETYLFRKTKKQIISSIKKCWASLYSPKALLYITQMNKIGKDISLNKIYMAVIIQKMINSEVSGVLFTTNVINNNSGEILINSTWGLGEALANNLVVPDTLVVDKKSCKIIKQIIGKKEKKVVPDFNNACTTSIKTNEHMRNQICLTNNQIEKLHHIALDIEKTYNYPQDIEWAIKNEELYILQSRPITTLE